MGRLFGRGGYPAVGVYWVIYGMRFYELFYLRTFLFQIRQSFNTDNFFEFFVCIETKNIYQLRHSVNCITKQFFAFSKITEIMLVRF